MGRRRLTAKQKKLITLIANGYRSEEIGQIMGHTLKTVLSKRSRLMGELGLRDIAEVTKFALRQGLTSLNEHRREELHKSRK